MEVLTHSSLFPPAQIKYIRVAESVSLPPSPLSAAKHTVHTNPFSLRIPPAITMTITMNSLWIRSRNRKRRTGGAESVGAGHDQQEEEEEEMDSTDGEVVEEVRRRSSFTCMQARRTHAPLS